MKAARVTLIADHCKRLLDGKQVSVNIPVGAERLEIRIERGIRVRFSGNTPLAGMAKLADVFFNGRKA